MKNETNPKRRDRVVAELNSNNVGYFEKDARLMEFVKFLMFLQLCLNGSTFD